MYVIFGLIFNCKQKKQLFFLFFNVWLIQNNISVVIFLFLGYNLQRQNNKINLYREKMFL
tara:strand:- start:3561 stop:3740 length:180 start_codon:yes stop_codon:yes gene_type:complete